MAATTKRIIDRAMFKIGVKKANIDLQPDQYEDAIFEMNAMMTAFSSSGIRLGYSVKSDIEDPMTVPDWSYGFVVTQLAIRMASEYKKEISVSLAEEASMYMKSVRNRIRNRDLVVALPPDLPIGQGYGRTRYRKFFGDTTCDEVRDQTDLWLDDDGCPVLDDETSKRRCNRGII